MVEAKGRIVHLEQQNEKLTRDFSAAKKKIASLEGKLQTLSGLPLRQPAPSINRPHPETAGGVNDKGQPMTGKIESAAGDSESSIIMFIFSLNQHLTCQMLNAISILYGHHFIRITQCLIICLFISREWWPSVIVFR